MRGTSPNQTSISMYMPISPIPNNSIILEELNCRLSPCRTGYVRNHKINLNIFKRIFDLLMIHTVYICVQKVYPISLNSILGINENEKLIPFHLNMKEDNYQKYLALLFLRYIDIRLSQSCLLLIRKSHYIKKVKLY